MSFVLLLFLSLTAVGADDRPNVMFILTEDQGDHLSFLGTPECKTPYLDAICRSGVYFRNAFVAYPVCSASKAAIYTGLHSHTNGILNNTHNYHKPFSRLTAEELGRELYRINRVADQFPTLVEILKTAGYYQGVTHKLHVAPVEKFPYDEFMHGNPAELNQFLLRATATNRPWFLLVNIPNSHRPYPNSDQEPIDVAPSKVVLPSYLPDTPIVRKDWAEYLAAIGETDRLAGHAMQALERSGQADNTIVIYMSDHGPTFQHGKMTLHDLGLRVPLSITVPGGMKNITSNALVSSVDLLPTLMELLDLPIPSLTHGQSIAGLLHKKHESSEREYVFAEISNRGNFPNDGIQERSVFDGRWKLIVRTNVEKGWRQVNADSRFFETWGNRTYDETVRWKDKFPKEYQILAEMDPQTLGGKVPKVELYDLRSDPDEMINLALDPKMQSEVGRLTEVLSDWQKNTNDPMLTQSLSD